LFNASGSLIMVKEASRGIHKFEHLWRVELSLHAEPVSGFSAVSVVSVAAVDSTIPGISGNPVLP
jgi:hypothetical protein